MVDSENKNICALCGSTKSYKFSRLRNENGIWDGKSYKCEACRGLLKNYGTIDKEKIKQVQDRHKETRHKSLIRRRVCCKCGRKDTIKRKSGKEDWYRHMDNNGNWTGKHICNLCYSKEYQERPDSQHNIMKNMAKIRSKKFIDFNKFGDLSDREIGYIIECIVCDTFGIKNYNDETNNYNSQFDSIHSEYKRLQIKGKSLNIIEKIWTRGLGRGKKFGDLTFDTMIFVCMDNYKPWKNVLRVYAIPYKELCDVCSITIYESSNSKWEDFRIDEKPFNNMWHDMMKRGYIELRKDKKDDYKAEEIVM